LPPLGDVKNRLHLACKVCNQIFGIKHFLVSFTEDLSYLAIVVKNVKEKYGKDYRLQKDWRLVNCICTRCFFS